MKRIFATIAVGIMLALSTVLSSQAAPVEATAMIEDNRLPGGPYHIKNSTTSDFGFRINDGANCTGDSHWLSAGDKAHSTKWSCASINTAARGYKVCVYDGYTGQHIVCREGQQWDEVRIYDSNDYIFYIRN